MKTISALAIAALLSSAAVATAQATSAAEPGDGQRDTKALNLLEANGYTAFSNFRAMGKNFLADVKQGNGVQRTVTVDPDTGTVTPQG
jgi:hypothetical protein